MKLSSTVLCLVVLVLTACRKRDNVAPVEPDYSHINIASITDVPPFIYEGNQLVAMGNERFSYDGKGRIIGSRIEWHDTSGPIIKANIYKTTFKWVNDLCVEGVSDSLYSYFLDRQGDIKDESLSSGDVLSSYSYNPSSRQLNSLAMRLGGWSNTFYTSLKYEYDNKGNLIRLDCRQPGSLVGPLELVYTITFEYDDHPNPFYAMYKKYGMILPFLQRFADRISPHNPTKIEVNSKNLAPLIQRFTYEYNEAGYPVKIIPDGAPGTVTVTAITYR